LRPGDIADAWWIPSGGSDQIPGVGWIEVAANATVVDIKDSTGKSLFASGGSIQQELIPSGMSSGSPSVAVLAVNASDVSRIIGGAIPKSENIVLTKKFSPSQGQISQPTIQVGD